MRWKLVYCLVLALMPGLSTAQTRTGIKVSQNDFEEALFLVVDKALPQIVPTGNSQTEKVLAHADRTSCTLGLVIASKNWQVFSSDQEVLLPGELRERLKRPIPPATETKVSDACRKLPKIDLSAIAQKAVSLLETPKVFAEAKAAFKSKEDAFDASLKYSSTNSAAKTVTLDVLGLVAGLSTKDDIEKVAHKRNNYCDPMCLTVGGFDMKCEAEYDSKSTLSTLTCWFGEGVSSGDNIEIFQVLERGFTGKFGKPRVRIERQIQNSLGAKFDFANPKWGQLTDNTLEMASRVGRVDRGAFALKSRQVMLDELAARVKEETGRKF